MCLTKISSKSVRVYEVADDNNDLPLSSELTIEYYV